MKRVGRTLFRGLDSCKGSYMIIGLRTGNGRTRTCHHDDQVLSSSIVSDTGE